MWLVDPNFLSEELAQCARVARRGLLSPVISVLDGISARHHSRNIGAPLEATGFLNWVSKDVTLRWKRDAITGTAS